MEVWKMKFFILKFSNSLLLPSVKKAAAELSVRNCRYPLRYSVRGRNSSDTVNSFFSGTSAYFMREFRYRNPAQGKDDYEQPIRV